jgi:hypothetical protein
MDTEIDKLIESKRIIQALANGINPLTGELVRVDSFLNDPTIIRPLFFLSQYLEKETNHSKNNRKKPKSFNITEEEMSRVVLPNGKIGVNDFAYAVNAVLNTTRSKKLNGAVINRKLKLLGILSEATDDEGKTRTVTNEKSEGYGIEFVSKVYNNREYQQVVFNDIGKKFLLHNIEKLMNYE